jgi:hypothetical protein
MNKLDFKSPATSLASSSASHSNPETTRRLIVLFPASEIDTPDLDHQIWEIARSLKLNVLFLSLSNDYKVEAQLRRKLINMAAMIKDPFVSTDIMIGYGNDWVGQVRKVWQAGDIMACYSGQKVGLMRRPIDQVLKSSLDATVYILSDLQPVTNPISKFISTALYWLGPSTIIAGFLWAEVDIVRLPQDWAHHALIYACILVEVVLLWLWNLLFT